MILCLVVALVISAGIGLLRELLQRPIFLSLSEQKRARPAHQATQTTQQVPAFLEEMRSRDQAMKAATSKAQKPQLDLQEMRRKEKKIVVNPRSFAP